MRELFKGKVDGEQREHNQSQQTTQNGRTALCCKPTNTITIFCVNTKFWEIGTYTKLFLKYEFLTLEGFHSKLSIM